MKKKSDEKKEGPGHGEESDDEEGLLLRANKQPRLFTMPEITSKTLSVGVLAVIGVVFFFLLFIAVLLIFMKESTLNEIKSAAVRLVNGIRGNEL